LNLAARDGAPQRMSTAHANAEPEGVKDRVEAPPVRPRPAEQRPKRGSKRTWPLTLFRPEHRKRVAAFGKPDGEAILAQEAGKSGHPRARP
jgi:hypothetical protein